MRFVIAVCLVGVLSLVYQPYAVGQEPENWVDFRADSLIIGFPLPDSIVVTVCYTFINGLKRDSIIAGDLSVFLDGIPVGGEPIGGTRSLNNCYVFQTIAECKGECYLSTYPPAVFGQCDWYVPDPRDTVVFEGCYCAGAVQSTLGAHYSGEENVSFYLDFDNVINEVREYNNMIHVNIGTIGTEPSTWGRIKSLFE